MHAGIDNTNATGYVHAATLSACASKHTFNKLLRYARVQPGIQIGTRDKQRSLRLRLSNKYCSARSAICTDTLTPIATDCASTNLYGFASGRVCTNSHGHTATCFLLGSPCVSSVSTALNCQDREIQRKLFAIHPDKVRCGVCLSDCTTLLYSRLHTLSIRKLGMNAKAYTPSLDKPKCTEGSP